jgi:hypothetical protein
MTGTPPFRHGPRLRSWVPDLLGVAWVLAAAGAVMAPAFAHGPYLGAFDWASRYGLSSNPGVVIHNPQAFDQISEFIPWTNLAWTQVHTGHLPLWNPYTVLGTPLAFNWQAGTFGIPALLGYLFPLRLAYTVQVLATLAIAGTGVYVLGRVLRLGAVGCTLAATVYELSGSLFAWLGAPITSVMSWAGWLFAATLLVVRGRHPARAVTFFAVVVACAVYAGQPDTLVNLASAFLVFLIVLLVARVPRFGGSGPIRRPLFHTVVAAGAGAALSAPLLLPGLQLLPSSLRTGKNVSQALPAHSIVLTLLQGFDGLPVAGSRWFGSGYYVKTAAYVGVIAVVLAVIAVVAAVRLRCRRPEVVAFSAVAVVMAGIVYLPPVESFLGTVPKLSSVQWHRSTTAMAFALAILAGMGVDVLVRSHDKRVVRAAAAYGFGAAAVLLLAVWGLARGHLPPVEASIRARSFIWPVASAALGLVVTGGLVWAHRGVGRPGRHRRHTGGGRRGWREAGQWAAAALLACETAFLITAGAPLWSSSATYLVPTPEEAALARAVGTSLVGFGTNTCFGHQLGIVPDLNVAFRVQELAAYEPLLPMAYGVSWRDATGHGAAPVNNPVVPFTVFCPAVTSAAIARRYGVGFVLERAGQPGPDGSVFAGVVGEESLFRVPGAAPATLTTMPASGTIPGLDAVGSEVPISEPNPASLTVVTHGADRQVLRLRLTAVPGWHASIDGRPLVLHTFAGVMLQAVIPPGRHVVKVEYWPATFTIGICLAVAAAVGLGSVLLYGRTRRGKRIGFLRSGQEVADRDRVLDEALARHPPLEREILRLHQQPPGVA